MLRYITFLFAFTILCGFSFGSRKTIYISSPQEMIPFVSAWTKRYSEEEKIDFHILKQDNDEPMSQVIKGDGGNIIITSDPKYVDQLSFNGFVNKENVITLNDNLVLSSTHSNHIANNNNINSPVKIFYTLAVNGTKIFTTQRYYDKFQNILKNFVGLKNNKFIICDDIGEAFSRHKKDDDSLLLLTGMQSMIVKNLTVEYDIPNPQMEYDYIEYSIAPLISLNYEESKEFLEYVTLLIRGKSNNTSNNTSKS